MTRRHWRLVSRAQASSRGSRLSRLTRAWRTSTRIVTLRDRRCARLCGQCHVEYYFKGEGKVVTYPWANGLKVEDIEAYYDREGFTDWVHAETGAKTLKAQHPEFEVWNQGIHARAGVACADCHMPYQRVGALKVSDHWVRSPLLNINRACQTCHTVPEKELESRVLTIQDRHNELL